MLTLNSQSFCLWFQSAEIPACNIMPSLLKVNNMITQQNISWWVVSLDLCFVVMPTALFWDGLLLCWLDLGMLSGLALNFWSKWYLCLSFPKGWDHRHVLPSQVTPLGLSKCVWLVFESYLLLWVWGQGHMAILLPSLQLWVPLKKKSISLFVVGEGNGRSEDNLQKSFLPFYQMGP